MGFRSTNFLFDSPAAAVAALAARVRITPPLRSSEVVELTAASGRILAIDFRTDRDSPPFDYAAMDGYAICLADVAEWMESETVLRDTSCVYTLSVVGEVLIGKAPPAYCRAAAPPGTLRIVTGAPIPHGVDTIIRREDVLEHATECGGEVASISFTAGLVASLKRSQHVRYRGENALGGTIALHAGEVMSSASLATLATFGGIPPTVFRRLRVAIITTGEELVEASETPSDFQIRNSNAVAVRTILASQPWIDVVSVINVRDGDDLAAALEHAIEVTDAVVTTGGVSMGHRDAVRAALERIGAEIIFHGLPQRPGKPVLGAVVSQHSTSMSRLVPVLALPGNPVAALVTCVRIVLPVLAAASGANRTPPACLPKLVQLRGHDVQPFDVWSHRLARLVVGSNGSLHAEIIPGRGSGDIVSAGLSDGFVEIPPGVPEVFQSFYAWPAGAS
ncbi:MAG: molybdopterin molybdotransferase MoeA [Phycisphaerae bacterium]|nr:molybdopterin molybdotransferase MoeA [Phycisphaerae bacterium]